MEIDRINQVYALQKRNKISAKNTSAKERLKKLKKLKKVVLEKLSLINEAVALDFNKPSIEVELTEVMPVVAYLNLLQSELADWMEDKKVSAPLLFKGTSSVVRYEGKGNCLIIGPWNYPFQLSLYPIITAIAAGNTVILKPSEFTPNTNKLLRSILSEVFEENEVSVIEGESETSQALLDLAFDHIFFTGSTSVGKIVMEKASKHLSSVALELGGKSPAIVDRETDLKAAAKKIMWGKLVNSGQTCVAPDYVLIHADQKDEFIKHALEVVEEFYENDYSSDYNQIITERHTKRLETLVNDAEKAGATIHGEKIIDTQKRIFSPLLLSNVNNAMAIMQDEIFGPVLPIVSFNSIDEMITFINEKDNALHMYIFSNDKKNTEKVINETFNGGVTVNDILLAVGHPELPFGGSGKSGIGRYHGKYGFEEFSNIRPVMKRDLDIGASYFYPPYTDKKKKIVHQMVKNFSRLF